MSFDHLAWAMRHADVQSSTQRLVLLALADAIRPGMTFCWPSQETLAATVKLNTDSVGRTIRQLEELGLVRIEKRFHEDGRRRPNAYHLPRIDLTAVFEDGEKTHPTQTRVVHDSHPTLTLEPSDAGSDKQVHKSNNQQASPYKPPKGGRISTRQTPGSEVYSQRFEDVWKSWPKGKGGSKADAYKAWLKRKLDDPEHSHVALMILHDVKNRASTHRQWLDGYPPHMSTYLNKSGWTADIDTSMGTRTNGRAKTTYEQIMEASERNRAALREDYDNMSDAEQREYRAAFGHS
jgi:hypothetical protein